MHEARKVFYRLLPLIQLLFAEPNPGLLKAALAMTAMLHEDIRSPMLPASAELRDKIAGELKRLESL